MNKSALELAADILIAALQSGKAPSYEAKDVAAYFDTVYRQIMKSNDTVYKERESQREVYCQ